ncbi:MAG: nuclear transport factor 2 family protein [Actinobacteria bacterium]|nr:nuclear transport factor 2 family protein [Actinomycetota bacterium]
MPSSKGSIEGKDRLRSYWTAALEANPDLHFELIDVYAGVDTVALHHANRHGDLVIEVLTFARA